MTDPSPAGPLDQAGQPGQLGPRLAAGRTAEVYAWGADQVVKLFFSGTPAGWTEREAHACRIVTQARLHAPRLHGTVEVNGRHGILFDRVQGPSLLDALMVEGTDTAALAERFAALHAELHRCRHVQLPSLRATLADGIGRATALLDDLRAALLAHLATLPDGDALCHGDYHPGNVIMAPASPAVIDWMAAGAGDPDADVARTVFLLGMSVLPPEFDPALRAAIEQVRAGFLAAYLAAYRAQRACPEAAIAAWLPVLAAARLTEGIPGEQARLLEIAGRVRG